MNSETTEERTRVRLKQALDLCEAAAALPPTERENFLSSACDQDAELRLTVTELLRSQAEAEASGFMESPAWSYTPPDANPHALVGQQVGAYRLSKFITQGGMGAVYLAERDDGFFDRKVAVKFILGNLTGKEYHRFRRETRILAKLQHPNLVFLFDAGRYGDGRPYLLMEYVEGENLRNFLKLRGALPREQVVEIARQACAGLQAAHEAGIIHRDIKPENIIVCEQQRRLSVKVLDFGIAYLQNALETNLTGDQVIGTAPYMSPEQMSGVRAEDLTPASDLYSLGLTVYEMITGQRAVRGETWPEVVHNQLNVTPTPPGALRPDLKLPAAVDRVVMKVLSKDPRQRYQTAGEFAAELDAAFREPWVSPDEPTASKPLPKGRSKVVSTLFVLAVAIAIAVGGYLAWSREPVGLSVDLAVQASPPRPFEKCNFVLLKPEITQMPAKIKDEDTLLVYSGIDDQGRFERAKDAKLPPGEYHFKFTCVGFKSVINKVRLQEDPQHPGRAMLPVKIEPE